MGSQSQECAAIRAHGGRQVHAGAYIKQGEPGSYTSQTGAQEPAQPCQGPSSPPEEQAHSMPGHWGLKPQPVLGPSFSGKAVQGPTDAACNVSLFPPDQMSLYFLPCLLLLPVGTCFPLLDREEPMDLRGGFEGEMSGARRAGEHRVHFPWVSTQWLRVPHAHILLVTAKELQMSGREHAGFRLRVKRQGDGSEAAGFLLSDSEKASSPLGTLAEGLNSYSRKKGGFSFRFGRR
ncbi:orexigenic neuropeptide QRFP [Rhynchonycteris naso]